MSEFHCPDCHIELQFREGSFGTGVFAPDGVEQTSYEDGYFCPSCKHLWSVVDLLKHEIEIELKDLPLDSEPDIDALERWLS